MNHRGIWLTATVLAVIVLLAQIAEHRRETRPRHSRPARPSQFLLT